MLYRCMNRSLPLAAGLPASSTAETSGSNGATMLDDTNNGRVRTDAAPAVTPAKK